MRTPLMIATVALALSACGKPNDTAGVTANSLAEASASDAISTPGQETPGVTTDNAATGAPIATADFVMTAAKGDMYEIESSKLALEKSANPKIKAFAQAMITMHTATTRDLKAAIAKTNFSGQPPADLDSQGEALIQALQSAERGAAFDQLYLAQQRDAHMNTLVLMQSYAQSGDEAALKTFASATAPKVEEHIRMLREIAG